MGLGFHGFVAPIAEIWRVYNAIRPWRQAAQLTKSGGAGH